MPQRHITTAGKSDCSLTAAPDLAPVVMDAPSNAKQKGYHQEILCQAIFGKIARQSLNNSICISTR